jgi:K+-transporting ATPase c subunit
MLLNKILPALLVIAVLILACGGSYALAMTGAAF